MHPGQIILAAFWAHSVCWLKRLWNSLMLNCPVLIFSDILAYLRQTSCRLWPSRFVPMYRRVIEPEFFYSLFEFVKLGKRVMRRPFELWRLRYFSDQVEKSLDTVLLFVHWSKQIAAVSEIGDFTKVDLTDRHVGILEVHEELVNNQMIRPDME